MIPVRMTLSPKDPRPRSIPRPVSRIHLLQKTVSLRTPSLMKSSFPARHTDSQERWWSRPAPMKTERISLKRLRRSWRTKTVTLLRMVMLNLLPRSLTGPLTSISRSTHRSLPIRTSRSLRRWLSVANR